jgi:hypothetical protein
MAGLACPPRGSKRLPLPRRGRGSG